MIDYVEIIFYKKFHSLYLLRSEIWLRRNVNQRVVISDNIKLVSIEVVSLFFQCIINREKLLVWNIELALSWREFTGLVSYWIPISIMQLQKYCF
jgi:hypothetical protein